MKTTESTIGLNQENLLPLERINILLAASELGEEYSFPPDLISNIFFNEKLNASYNEVMCCLFYIKNQVKYSHIKDLIKNKIYSVICNDEGFDLCSEKYHFFVDGLACPYIENSDKFEWVKFYIESKKIRDFGKAKIEDAVSEFTDVSWFINWNEIDMLNMLERKRLLNPYH